MKKVAVILLLLIYGSTTIGATIHLHYCMNEFVGWGLWHGDKDNKCGKCGMKEKKDGCCKDEHKQVKLKTEHQKSGFVQYFQLFKTPALFTPVEKVNFGARAIAENFPAAHAPPKIPKGRLHILHCVFLI